MHCITSWGCGSSVESIIGYWLNMARYTCPRYLSGTVNRACEVHIRSRTEGRHISPHSVNNIFITKKSKMLQPLRGWGGHFFPIGPITQTLEMTLSSSFLSSVGKFHSAYSEKRSKMSHPIRGWAAILFPIGPKNTNLVEDVEFLLSVQFRQILFSGFREEVENVKS